MNAFTTTFRRARGRSKVAKNLRDHVLAGRWNARWSVEKGTQFLGDVNGASRTRTGDLLGAISSKRFTVRRRWSLSALPSRFGALTLRVVVALRDGYLTKLTTGAWPHDANTDPLRCQWEIQSL
jgi:hypothetical protein